MKAEDNQDENLKELYTYSKEVLNEERNIFRDIENKASKYLAVFTALLAAAGFFANWIGLKVLSPKDCLETALLVNGITLILVIFVTWLVVFWVLKVGKFEELPLDKHIIDFFLEKPIQKVHREVADGIKDAMAKNAETRQTKVNLLKWGHKLIIATWVLLLSFTCLFVVYKGRTSAAKREVLDHTYQIGLGHQAVNCRHLLTDRNITVIKDMPVSGKA